MYKSSIGGLIWKAEIEITDVENRFMDTKEERGRWDELGYWD